MRSYFKKHRVISFVVGVALTLTAGASAAWIVFTYIGTNGTANGGFATIQSGGTKAALTFSNNGAAPANLSPGTSEDIPVTLTNNNPNAAETETGLNSSTVTYTSTPTDCAAHLTTAGYSPSVLAAVPPASAVNGTITVAADAMLPVDCSGGSFLITVDAGSNP